MRRSRLYRAVTETLETRRLLSAPTDLTLSAQEIAEDAHTNQVVGQFALVDDGTSFSYEFVAGEGDADNAAFGIQGSNLKLKTALDFETKSSYTIRVKGTDQEGLSCEKAFTINVTNVVEPIQAANDAVDTNGRLNTRIDVLANDQIDSSANVTVSVSEAQAPAHGTVVVNSDGSIRYVATLGFTGRDTFYYTVDDGNGDTDTARVNVDVTIPELADVVVCGTSGDDTINAFVVDDTLKVQVNDQIRQFVWSAVQTITILGSDGNDTMSVDSSVTMGVTMSGGAGNDTITGGDNNDLLLGCEGDDLISGGLGDDSINGGGGNDMLKGNDGNDWIAGMDGADSIRGNVGDDQIFAGSGNDSIDAGLGNDSVCAGADDDVVDGREGLDTIMGDGGNDDLFGAADCDTIVGGDGNDTVRGGAGDDLCAGGAGNDAVYGGVGNDNVCGGAGDDNCVGGDGADTISGDAGNDMLDSQDDVTDWVSGGDGDDTGLHGWNDILVGCETH